MVPYGTIKASRYNSSDNVYNIEMVKLGNKKFHENWLRSLGLIPLNMGGVKIQQVFL
jgi:hypothetical protein